jgi:hypothetical protein
MKNASIAAQAIVERKLTPWQRLAWGVMLRRWKRGDTKRKTKGKA